MIAVITYGTVLFALMISQWRGETVSVSVSVKERGEKKEKNKTRVRFGVYMCGTCLFCLSDVARHTEKECFCFWESWLIHIFFESHLNNHPILQCKYQNIARRHFGRTLCDNLSYFYILHERIDKIKESMCNLLRLSYYKYLPVIFPVTEFKLG